MHQRRASAILLNKAANSLKGTFALCIHTGVFTLSLLYDKMGHAKAVNYIRMYACETWGKVSQCNHTDITAQRFGKRSCGTLDLFPCAFQVRSYTVCTCIIWDGRNTELSLCTGRVINFCIIHIPRFRVDVASLRRAAIARKIIYLHSSSLSLSLFYLSRRD